jgi:hypothetical protein
MLRTHNVSISLPTTTTSLRTGLLSLRLLCFGCIRRRFVGLFRRRRRQCHVNIERLTHLHFWEIIQRQWINHDRAVGRRDQCLNIVAVKGNVKQHSTTNKPSTHHHNNKKTSPSQIKHFCHCSFPIALTSTAQNHHPPTTKHPPPTPQHHHHPQPNTHTHTHTYGMSCSFSSHPFNICTV